QLIADIERDSLHREILRTQGSLTTRFALDPLGRKQGIWTQHSGLRTALFSANDPTWQKSLQTSTAPNGKADRLSGLMKGYAYDLTGELRGVQHSLNGKAQHRYDATGRIEETLRALRSAPSIQSTQNGSAANQSSVDPNRSEYFAYDPAGNLLDQAAAKASTQGQQRGYVRDNLVRVFEDKRYAYDGHGRLIQKLSGKHTKQTFKWDDEHRLIEVATTRRPNTPEATTQTTQFDYDALGRRVAKHDSFGTTRFIWEGMRLIEERRASNVVTYVYEPDSYVPLARIDAKGEQTEQGGLGTTVDPQVQVPAAEPAKLLTPFVVSPSNHERTWVAANDDPAKWEALQPQRNRDAKQSANAQIANVYYFHTDQVGLPEELSDQEGNIRWRAFYKTWGSTVSETWEVTALNGESLNGLAHAYAHDASPQARANARGNELEQNLRFQGQYLDRDTGLHYNTFRFYDPDIGRFISPDPIGLEGGTNLQSYAPSPVIWIDPWGLTTCQMSAANVRAMGPAPSGMRNPHLHHIIREMAPKNWSKSARGAIHHVQNLARKYGIDVNRDPRNFTWAQNGGGAHTRATAQYIRTQLAAADKAATQAGNPQIFFDKMAQIGRDASNGIFRRP
ncbi:MAG: RHS repeat-associated core domain-containing protein, partial [Casimicrobium sp.]